MSETYTIYVNVADGARLWVNDQLVIDQWWNDIDATEYSVTVPLTAGQYYPIELDYFQNERGSPQISLSWSTPFSPKTIIPQSQLSPVYLEPPPVLSIPQGNAFSNGVFQLQVAGRLGSASVLQANDLTNWTALNTIVAPASSFLLQDSTASNQCSQFYRVVRMPTEEPDRYQQQ